VVCSPWEGEPYLASRHASYAAARRCIQRRWKGFRGANTNGYGYKWEMAVLVATPYCACGPAWEIYEDRGSCPIPSREVGGSYADN
jgi:hypothetical protein